MNLAPERVKMSPGLAFSSTVKDTVYFLAANAVLPPTWIAVVSLALAGVPSAFRMGFMVFGSSMCVVVVILYLLSTL